MLNNRPANYRDVASNSTFRGHAKGMGKLLDYYPPQPQFSGVSGLGDDSGTSVDLFNSDGSLPQNQILPVTPVASGSGASQSFTSNTFSDAIFDWLTANNVDPSTATVLSSPIVWLGVGALAFVLLSEGGRRR